MTLFLPKKLDNNDLAEPSTQELELTVFTLGDYETIRRTHEIFQAHVNSISIDKVENTALTVQAMESD
ncbi:hypothetical protein PG984_014237 [Apiospora sp. TS-2023a]